MAESRWRLQVFRDDGSVKSEQTFTNSDQAYRAFDALAPSIPKRLQVRVAGKARYATLESEGATADGAVTHAFKAAPNWADVCDVCGESENDPRHGAP